MSFEFLRVITFGGTVPPAAEFDTGEFPTRKCRLNAKSLRGRIANLDKYNMDTAQEELALAALER